MNEIELAPLRTLDDFILGSARFQIPNYKDLEKWGNRVVNNLLYYQTNYFLMALVVFLLVGVLHPTQMLFGTIAIGVAFGLFYYFTNTKRTATQFKKNHPILGVLLIISGGYFIVYMLGSVLVFLFGILLPICIVFVHSSMRLRNIKNKLSNKMETIGLKKTPMGIFLESLGSNQIQEELFRRFMALQNPEVLDNTYNHFLDVKATKVYSTRTLPPNFSDKLQYGISDYKFK